LARPRLGRPILAGLFVAYTLLSINLAWYIHARHGSPSGDFGVTYSHQLATEKPPR
jgi:hypothetical protein